MCVEEQRWWYESFKMAENMEAKPTKSQSDSEDESMHEDSDSSDSEDEETKEENAARIRELEKEVCRHY